MESIKAEIAAAAARMVVEEGLEYGPAKYRAVRQLGSGARSALPDNDALDDAVREYIAVFCGDTQPQELLALRRLALLWMDRLAPFRPYLTGSVWQGTATRLSDIYLQLFCDDSKSAELALIDHHIAYEAGSTTSPSGQAVSTLHFSVKSHELGEAIGLHLTVLDHDDLRGALKPDRRGRPPRGDAAAVRRILEVEA